MFLLLIVTRLGYQLLQDSAAVSAEPSIEAQQSEEVKQPEEAQQSKEPGLSEEAGESKEPQQPIATDDMGTEEKAPAESVSAQTEPPFTGDKEKKGEEGMTEALGKLHVEGTSIVNEQGERVQLRGISTHGIAWFPQFVNQEFFTQLHKEWKADVVRLAMYTAENGGYCTDGDQESLRQLVKDGVAYAKQAGLYVIVDWHILSDCNPNTYKAEAIDFFSEMAEAFAEETHVIYEICNEPNGGVQWSEIKSYAQEVIEVIRQKDEDAIILVGTPNWSQLVDQAAQDPITGYENIMYTLHFYAGTHKETLRRTMIDAVEGGLPVFVSEYGISDASGNGALDYEQAEQWVKAMDSYGISYVAWNISNKAESSSIFRAECTKISDFTQEDLNPSGRWLLELLTGETISQTGNELQSSYEPQKTPAQSAQTVSEASQPSAYTAPAGITEADLAITADSSELTVHLKSTDTWSTDNGSCYNCTMTIANMSENDITGWEICIDMTGKSWELLNGWNGEYQTEGEKLRITNKDYNALVTAGGEVSDIGFILQVQI